MAKLLSESTAKWIAEQRGRVATLATRIARTPYVGNAFSGWRQWQVSVVDAGLRVRSGSLAWGGGHYAVWPAGRTVGRDNFDTLSTDVPEGATRYVLWFTRCHACPLTYCPKAPNGTTLCPAAAGDPESWRADAGDVILAESPDRQEGWTDYRVLAVVSRDADGYTINQIQTAEITVRAIVYPGEQGEESDDEETEDPTNCSDSDSEKFPSDVDDTEGPKDPEEEDSGGGGEDDEQFPSKIDVCW